MKNIGLKTMTMLLVLGCLVATGCRKKPAKVTPLPNAKGGSLNGAGELPNGPILGGGDNTIGAYDATKGTPMSNQDRSNWAQDRSTLSADTVYFAYDSATIKPGETSKLDSVASYLKSNPNAALRIEGNCDERGTEDYNRALGERRALSAREYLIQAGVDGGRIDTHSNGEDKPAEAGHSEAAWGKNRRDEFVVLTAP